MDGFHNANMISFITEGDFHRPKSYWGNSFPVEGRGFKTTGIEAKELRLLGHQLHVVLGTILDCEMKEML